MDVVGYMGHSVLTARQQDLQPFFISDGELEILQEHKAQAVEIYHLAIAPVRVHWNSLSLIESSMMLFDEHHR